MCTGNPPLASLRERELAYGVSLCLPDSGWSEWGCWNRREGIRSPRCPHPCPAPASFFTAAQFRWLCFSVHRRKGTANSSFWVFTPSIQESSHSRLKSLGPNSKLSGNSLLARLHEGNNLWFKQLRVHEELRNDLGERSQVAGVSTAVISKLLRFD